MTSRQRLLANLALGLGILLALELLCQASERGSKYTWSETYGYRLAPGYEGRRESVNGDGLRGAEVSPRETIGLRILAMGGSTTWGHKIADDETWPHALEAFLGDDVEVLNGGVSGWGLEQIVIALRDEYLERFEPDLVIIFSGWNHAALADNPQVPRYRARAPSSEEKPLLFRSALVRWIDDWIADARGDDAGEQRSMEERLERRADIRRIMRGAFPRLYDDLAELSDERGVPILIVRYPGLVGVPRDVGGTRDAHLGQLLNLGGHPGLDLDAVLADAQAQYTGALAVIDAEAERAGLAVLDAAGRMEAELPATDRDAVWMGYFRDRMHLTPVGNAALGRSLGELLTEGDWLER